MNTSNNQKWLWDGHIHSEFSDGVGCYLGLILDYVVKYNVKSFAMPDHDTVSGNIVLNEFVDMIKNGPRKIRSGKVDLFSEEHDYKTSINEETFDGIRGGEIDFTNASELSFSIKNSNSKFCNCDDVHLLCYGITDLDGFESDPLIKRIQKERQRRSVNIINIYKEKGIKDEDIEINVNDIRSPYISRWHIAAKLFETLKGLEHRPISPEKRIEDIRNQTAKGGSAYVPFSRDASVSEKEIFKFSKKYGKLSILAHPGTILKNYRNRLEAKEFIPLLDYNNFTPYAEEKLGQSLSIISVNDISSLVDAGSSIEDQYSDKIGKKLNLNFSNFLHTIKDYLFRKSALEEPLKIEMNIVKKGIEESIKEGFEGLLLYLHKLGLNGVEAYSSKHSDDITRMIEETVKKVNKEQKLKLIKTLGSDYHGHEIRPDLNIGTGKEDNLVKYNNYEDCKIFKKALGL